MSDVITVGSIAPELLDEAESLRALAGGYSITSPELREAASTDLRTIKAQQKTVDEQEKSITRPINDGLKRVRDMFRRPKEWLNEAEAILKRECLRWDGEQERERQAALAEASRKADEERRRLEAAAEREASAGNHETAQAIKEAAVMVAPLPPVPLTKIAGESHREIWRAEVGDIVALCRAVADGKAPAVYVEPNMINLNGAARMMKGELNIPGVKATVERILSARSAPK